MVRGRPAVLKAMCTDREGRPREPAPPAVFHSEGEKLLVKCLQSDSGCTGGGDSGPKVLAAASNLTGIKMLASTLPECFVMTEKGTCGKYESNPTSSLPGRLRWKSKLKMDYRNRQYTTCAIVANGPLSKISKNGKVINEHEAVFRFNLMTPANQAAYIGTKTTIRMFNRLRGLEAAGGREGRGTSLKATRDETWIFWHMNSVAYLEGVKAKFPGTRVTLLHGYAIRWAAEVYLTLRTDLLRMGLGKYICPENLSSGVQAALLAQKLCGEVNTFGYSYSKEILGTRPGHMNGRHSMHTAHSWDFDVLLIRLLHLAGRLNICTADDPNISVDDLQKRKGGLSAAG